MPNIEARRIAASPAAADEVGRIGDDGRRHVDWLGKFGDRRSQNGREFRPDSRFVFALKRVQAFGDFSFAVVRFEPHLPIAAAFEHAQ